MDGSRRNRKLIELLFTKQANKIKREVFKISYIYLTTKDLSCSFSNNQIIIKKDNTVVDTEPIETIEGIVLKESSLISSKTISQLLKRNVPITYIDHAGKYLGGFTNNKVDIEKQVNQFKCKEDPIFCLEFAKKIITSKVKNQIVILKRYDKLKLDKIKDIVYSLNKYISEIENCTSINEVIGFEGTCARLYFNGISCLVPDEFKFDKRSKRPPKDPFNALLSYGYSLLYNEIILAIIQIGLNPYAGFMHQDKQGHATLASDLMEQWRAPIVDSLILKLITKKIIKASDFTKNENTGGYYLSKKANSLFINHYENKIRTKNSYFKHADYPMSFRQSIFFNIYELISSFEDKNLDNFKTLILR